MKRGREWLARPFMLPGAEWHQSFSLDEIYKFEAPTTKTILALNDNLKFFLSATNNFYPQIFSLAVSSLTLIKKKIQDSFDLDVFFYFSQSDLRGDVILSATIFYSFYRCIQGPTAHADQLLSQLPRSANEDNSPFSQKATSILIVFIGNPFEMRLLNLRINFYLWRTFCPHLGRIFLFFFCFFFHYVSAKFHLWPSSGD